MKKILSVSILAVLAVAPLSARADTTGHYNTSKSVSDTNTDGGIAAVSYVKGAYDAAVEVVNEEYDRAVGAESGLSNRIGTLAADGNYIEASNTKNVSENLGLLDAAVKTNADHIGTISEVTAAQGTINGQTTLVGAVKALNTAVGNAGTASTVGSGHHYVGSDHLTNADNTANTADDNNVANNIIALDNQVYANTTAIGTLNGAKGAAGSVATSIDTQAAGATFGTTHTTPGTSVFASTDDTIGEALDKLDSEVVKLEGGANVTGSVLQKIQTNAQTADFATQNSDTNFNNAETIGTAIDQLDAAVYNLKNGSGAGTVAYQIKTQAESADFTNDGTNITADTLAGAITEVSNRQVPVYTTWGANGAASGTAKVSLVAPTTSGTGSGS